MCLAGGSGKGYCGPKDDKWNKDRVDKKIEEEESAGTTCVLPLATIIETGNHIAQAHQLRYKCAGKLAQIMQKIAHETKPWAAFSVQIDLWSNEKFIALAEKWPEFAKSELSLGDVTIVDVAKYYEKIDSLSVEILTADKGLKTYEPGQPTNEVPKPRRRQRK